MLGARSIRVVGVYTDDPRDVDAAFLCRRPHHRRLPRRPRTAAERSLSSNEASTFAAAGY
jgi:hypothetical protein